MHQVTLARIVQTCTIHNILNTNICHLCIPLHSAETLVPQCPRAVF